MLSRNGWKLRSGPRSSGSPARPSPGREALFASGVTVADLLTDDGTVDAAKVQAAAQNAAATLGLAPPVRQPRPDLSQGVRGLNEPPRQESAWGSFLAKR